jgi:hypothetical protein
MGTLAPVARRACAGTGPVPAQAQLASLEVIMPGWPAALAAVKLPSRYGPMVKFCKFGQPPRPWPPRVTNYSLFESGRRQVEGGVRGPTRRYYGPTT